MNKPNNKRSRDTDENIIRAAYSIMVAENKPVSKITVREICEMADINRSTFYAHYLDVYDLFDRVERQVAKMCTDSISEQLRNGGSMKTLLEIVFTFVEAYKEFYGIYFKEINRMVHMIELLTEPFWEQIGRMKETDLGYGIEDEAMYHFYFFTAGFSATLARWVENGCRESPRDMVQVMAREYGDSSLVKRWLESEW